MLSTGFNSGECTGIANIGYPTSSIAFLAAQEICRGSASCKNNLPLGLRVLLKILKKFSLISSGNHSPVTFSWYCFHITMSLLNAIVTKNETFYNHYSLFYIW